MDEKSLEMLEFPKAREILARFTSFSASQHLALNLRPSSDPALISQLLSQSAEARHLLSLEPDFSIGGSVDIRGDVEMATRGKVLDPQVLLTVEATLAIIRRVRAGIQKHSDEFPLLWSIAENIVELPHIEEEIKRSISPTGELLDSASTELAALRSQSKETNQQLLEHLEYIIHSPQAQRLLQDSFISEREGRYVIPIRIELRKEMKGIVHDVSNTGATAFVEPWSTVEMGNELRQLTIEEKREIERILTAISAEIWAYEAEISHNVELLAEIDLALAKARYAARVNATEPTIDLASRSKPGKQSPGAGALRLINARHPLLGDKAVPLTVELGNDYSILIITGPNTGGKTVALKTIGLLTLMTHAGIPIPAAAESCIPILDGVFADIGDEQSIEQTLSSFSWHMGNIVHILRSATERSLVLLDELGTSTNPGEGAALARAILLDFLARGNIAVATTHFSELKMFAHTTPGLRNASLDFDPVTLMPTCLFRHLCHHSLGGEQQSGYAGGILQ
ncbi:MAG: endonuclease MutS2, partial [Chloroflexota bacterium]|nr:endonuclease MutS2 [Chloroflexota bacterium]